MYETLSFHEQQYFADRKDDQFIFETIGKQMFIAGIKPYKQGAYYFNSIHSIKCDTTKAISLKELAGHEVRIKDNKLNIFGKIGGDGWGVGNTRFVYIFWNKVTIPTNFLNVEVKHCIPTKFPMPSALYNVNNLVYLGHNKQ